MYDILAEQLPQVKHGYVPLHYPVGGVLVASDKPMTRSGIKSWDAKHCVAQNMDALLRIELQLESLDAFIKASEAGKSLNKFTVVKDNDNNGNAMLFQLKRLIKRYSDMNKGASPKDISENNARLIKRRIALNNKLAVMDCDMVVQHDLKVEIPSECNRPMRKSPYVKDNTDEDTYLLELKDKNPSVIKFEPVLGFYQNHIGNMHQVKDVLTQQQKVVKMVLKYNEKYFKEHQSVLERWYAFFSRKQRALYQERTSI